MTSEDNIRSSQPAVVVEGLPRLLALHKICMEAKFHENPENAEIAGSPHAAALAHDVVDAIVEAERIRGGEARAEEWRRWRAVVPDWVRARVVGLASGYPRWGALPDQERREWLANALSPFRIGSDDIQLLLSAIDAQCQRPDRA